MNNNNEQTCRNCKHYLEHYIKKSNRFFPIGGHCINDELNKLHPQNRGRLYDNCEYWESDIPKKAERRDNIKSVLREIRNHLNEIECILKDDE